MLLPDSMELRICVPYHSRATAWASFDGRGRVELKREYSVYGPRSNAAERVRSTEGDHIKVTASAYPFPTVCADKQSTDWFLSIARTLKWNERQRQKSFVILVRLLPLLVLEPRADGFYRRKNARSLETSTTTGEPPRRRTLPTAALD